MSDSATARSSPVPTSAATAGYLKEKMHNTCTALLKKGLYLGDTGIVNQVSWVCIGKSDCLVTTDAAAEYQSTCDLFAADPKAQAPATPDLAVLSAVVFIPEEDYWLTSDTGWKGPTAAATSFADVKPSCTGQQPEHEVFAPDFVVVLRNIKDLLEKGCMKGFPEIKGIIIKSSTGASKLKFHHILFEVRCSSLGIYSFVLIMDV